MTDTPHPVTDHPVTGGCLCGAVRYSVDAQPVMVRQCWCRVCQYWASGSATVNVVFPLDKVTITGPLTQFISVADSGNRMVRSFCPTCGTPMTSASEARPHLIILRAGTLDDTSIARPTLNIWKDSAPAWAHHDPALPSTPRQPPPI